jgi:hypothetical protein
MVAKNPSIYSRQMKLNERVKFWKAEPDSAALGNLQQINRVEPWMRIVWSQDNIYNAINVLYKALRLLFQISFRATLKESE